MTTLAQKAATLIATPPPSQRIANLSSMSVGDKAFFQLVYSCVIISLKSQTPNIPPPSSMILRLTNCNGCGSSPNMQYNLKVDLTPLTVITQYANNGLFSFIQDVLTQVLVTKDAGLSPVDMFFANFQTTTDLATTLANHVPAIYLQQLQNVAKILAGGLFDIRNYDCTKNGTLAINTDTIINAFADQVTSVIGMSCSQCIVAQKSFSFYDYNATSNVIGHTIGKNYQSQQASNSFCVLNTMINSTIDSITFQIESAGNVNGIHVCAIDSNGLPLQQYTSYTSNNVYYAYPVNPGQGYAVSVILTSGPLTVNITGMSVSYKPYSSTPSAPMPIYYPPLANTPILIKAKNTSYYLSSSQKNLVSKLDATPFYYNNITNTLLPPILGYPCRIMSYGSSAFLAQTPGETGLPFLSALIVNPNDTLTTTAIGTDTWSMNYGVTNYGFDYEYVLFSPNGEVENSSLVSYNVPIAGDTLLGMPQTTSGFVATNVSNKNISLLHIDAQQPFGVLNPQNNLQSVLAINYVDNMNKKYSASVNINNPGGIIFSTPGQNIVNYSLSFPGLNNNVTVKPYVKHTSIKVLNANEYMLPSSLLISNGNNGDFLYDGTNQYFACLNNGDLCFCSINKGVLFSSHSITNGNGAFLIFTNDGKLSVVDKSGTTLWITNNVAVNGGTFKIQENGDYVIFDENANPIWSQRGIVPGSNVLLSA